MNGVALAADCAEESYEIINGDDAPFYADDAIYQEWRSGVFGDNAPVDLPWHNVDELVHPNE